MYRVRCGHDVDRCSISAMLRGESERAQASWEPRTTVCLIEHKRGLSYCCSIHRLYQNHPTSLRALRLRRIRKRLPTERKVNETPGVHCQTFVCYNFLVSEAPNELQISLSGASAAKRGGGPDQCAQAGFPSTKYFVAAPSGAPTVQELTRTALMTYSSY